MAIYKRKKVWWVSFTAPGGKRIRRSAGTEDKKQAQEFHDQLKAEHWRIERLGEKPKRTWQEAVVRWLQEKEHKRDLNKDIAKLNWLDRFLGGRTLDKIDRDLLVEIAKAKKATASPATANRYLALVRAILRSARDEWDWIDRIPTVPMSPEPSKRVRWISREEARLLMRELPHHLAELAVFTLATGLRQRNCSMLRWDQVDLVRGMAWIHPDESKSGRGISVPLNEDAVSVLRTRLGKDAVYVFTFRGKPVARTSTKAWYKALKRAGIEDFRWHDLRHTWASWHVQSGTSLQELMELGGWASFEMVLRYAHISGIHLKEAASRIQGTNLAQTGELVYLLDYS
jgi:integrase